MNSDIVKDILEIQAENKGVEFKRFGSNHEGEVAKILETIVAFTNTEGGLIIFGVDDPAKSTHKGISRVFGIEENLQTYDALGRETSRISPPIASLWPPTLISIPGKDVRIGLLAVPKAVDSLRSINNHVYIRGETGNKRLNPQEIIHFAYVKGFERADKELVNVDFQLLQTIYYEEWRKKRAITTDDIKLILQKTGLAGYDMDSHLKPTLAAVLLFAEFPNELTDTKCAVRIFQYEGNIEKIGETLNLLGTPHNITGPIIKQIRDAHEYVLNILKAGIKVPSGFVTKYKIPERAIRESITNAVIHRDYHTKKDIVVRIFEDHIQIESPGLFPFNITSANIGIERAFGYRNDLLVKHLREFPDPPNLDENEGIRAMRAVMREQSLYPPIFYTYPHLQDGVRVMLLNQTASSEWDKIADYLTKNKYISNSEAREILDTENIVEVSKLFNRWVKKGLLFKIEPSRGAKRNVKYRLPSTDEKNLFTNR